MLNLCFKCLNQSLVDHMTLFWYFQPMRMNWSGAAKELKKVDTSGTPGLIAVLSYSMTFTLTAFNPVFRSFSHIRWWLELGAGGAAAARRLLYFWWNIVSLLEPRNLPNSQLSIGGVGVTPPRAITSLCCLSIRDPRSRQAQKQFD